MSHALKSAFGLTALLLSAPTLAQITLYEGEGFRGRAFTTERSLPDFARSGFNNRVSSVIVDGGRWEACEDTGFRGHCVVLRQGSYSSLERMGIDNRLSSIQKVGNNWRSEDARPEPVAEPNYEYRRRPREQVYEADVTSVHAVFGRAEESCWVEREKVEGGRGDRNVAGGVVGGLIGAVLGHQIGGGRGKDLATVGGAVVGAAIGSNQGRGSSDEVRDVRHCETAMQSDPDYWDVEYEFRNVDHRIQMSAPPGDRIYVNRDGEPRQ